MPVCLCHIHARLEHQHTEGNTRYPAHEAYYTEDREENKDDGGRVELFDEVEDGGADTECNVQDACDPYELFCKSARHCKVKPRKSEGDAEDEYKEDDRVRVEGEVVRAAVDAAAIEAFGG